MQEINKQFEETTEILNDIDYNEALEYATWSKEKAKIKFQKDIPSFYITNNNIYWCNLEINIGSEQNKLRPVLILKTSKNSTICTIIPLTSKRLNDEFLFHIDLEEIDSTVLVEQLKVVSKIRITQPFRKKGKLVTISKNDWNKINDQLKKLYRLRPLKEE